MKACFLKERIASKGCSGAISTQESRIGQAGSRPQDLSSPIHVVSARRGHVVGITWSQRPGSALTVPLHLGHMRGVRLSCWGVLSSGRSIWDADW
jgi:hypothetical protein